MATNRESLWPVDDAGRYQSGTDGGHRQGPSVFDVPGYPGISGDADDRVKEGIRAVAPRRPG